MSGKSGRRIASIKEIAKLANCSIATVSNALNNKGRISEEVSKKIHRICRKHGYTPNSAGRMLRRSQSETIGLLYYPSCAALFRNAYYAQIMEAIEMSLEAASYDVLFSGSKFHEWKHTPPRFVRQNKVDGVILLGDFPKKAVMAAETFGLPLILIDNHHPGTRVDSITTNGYQAIKDTVQHLVEQGHERLAFLAYAGDGYNASQRQKGFEDAVQDHGLSAKDNQAYRDFVDDEEALALVQRLLASRRPPTAVIAVNDTLAVYLLTKLQNLGLEVPKDLGLAGFDNDPFSRTTHPPITTVRVDTKELGQSGTEILLKRIADPDRAQVNVQVAAELIARESTTGLEVPQVLESVV